MSPSPEAGLLDSVQAGVAWIGADGRIRRWNRWLARATGISAERAVDAPAAEVLPEFWARHGRDLEQVAAGGGHRQLSALLHGRLLPLHDAAGAPMPHDVLASPFSADAGEPRGVLLTVRSVADLFRAYEELRSLFDKVSRGKRLWEAAFDAVDDLVWVVSGDGVVERANLAVAAHLGRPVTEIVGRPCAEGFGGGTGCGGCKLPAGVEGDAVAPCLGERFRFEARPLGDSGAVVCTAQDLTDLKEAWRQAARAQKTFALVRLVAGASHELNNPLMAISGSAELLTDVTHGIADVTELLGIIREAVDRAASVVRRLQGFARLTVDPPVAVDVHRVVADLVARLPRPPGVEVRVEVPADTVVWSQPARVETLFRALLTNGLQTVGDAGAIVVGGCTETPSGEVHLWVEDTGAGFAPEVIGHVFDPFFTTRQPGEGAGLGLSECQGIVEDAGGRIEASNHVGGGGRIDCWFPSIPPDKAPWGKSSAGLHDRLLGA